MDISLRSVLTAGVTAITATAIVAAPTVTQVPEPEAVAVPMAVVTADVMPANWASDLSSAVYSVSRYWANYASLQLAPWALGWVPFGYLISDQIFIWYPGGWSPGFVLPVVDTYVNSWLNPVLNDPLNPVVWSNGFLAVSNTAINGAIGSLGNEITYALSLQWLPFPIPPLPPLPFATTQQAQLRTADELASPLADDFVKSLRELPERLLNLDPQNPLTRIVSLLQESSDRIVEAGRQVAGDLVADIPDLGIGNGKVPFATPPAADVTLAGDGQDVQRSLLDVSVPKLPKFAAGRRAALEAAPGELSEVSEKPANKFNRASRLAEAKEVRRESAEKATTTVREGVKSLREGLRKAAGSVAGQRGPTANKAPSDTPSGPEKPRERTQD